MRKALMSVVAFMAVFVVVGTVVSAVMMRGRSVAVRSRWEVPGRVHVDNVEVDRVRRVLEARADAFAREFGVLRCEVTLDGRAIDLAIVGRDAERIRAFESLLTSPGLVTFHEAAPAAGPQGRSDCPDGFVEASFSDWIYRTKGDFGEKVERRTDLYLREARDLAVGSLAECTYHTEGVFREPVVTLAFWPRESARFGELTERLQGGLMALCVDGDVRAAAIVKKPVRDGRVQIRGLRNNDAASRLAAMLRAGALPCELRQTSRRSDRTEASTHAD